MEKIVIKNFLTIKEVELEIKPFTVLIGDNAEGKSVIAKVLFILRAAAHYFAIAPLLGNKKLITAYIDEVKRIMINTFKGVFKPTYVNSPYIDGYIKYYYDDKILIKVSISSGDAKIRVYHDNFPILFVQDKSIEAIQKIFEILSESVSSQDDFRKIIHGFILGLEHAAINSSGSALVYIPHSRSIYMHIDALKDYTKISDIVDPLLLHFMNEFDLVVRQLSLKQDCVARNMMDRYEKYEIDLIRGYIHINHEDKVIMLQDVKNKNQHMHLSMLSSGQQELLPILLFLRKAIFKRQEMLTLIIEEPEAHLFPKRQIDLVYLFSFIRNKIGTRFFLTTHSPYIISAVNNLLLAWKEFQDSQSTALKKEYEDIWMNPNDVSVYEVRDGKVRNLIGEDGLIDANVIDLVMEFVSDEIDRILSLAQKE